MAMAARYDTIRDAALTAIARRGFHQASIREIARGAHLSLAGLYHYVAGKDQLLFLVVDEALDTLLDMTRTALAAATTPEERLRALVHTHLAFGFHHADRLRVVNRDWEQLDGPDRAQVVTKRRAYMDRWLDVLRELDPHRRSDRELFSAVNLLLGMLNGIAVRPFLRSADDAARLAGQVAVLFLHGFLHAGGAHDGG